jgi:hypothetical protein
MDAPEVMAQKANFSEMIDIYSFGITALELGYNSTPYDEWPPLKVLIKLTVRFSSQSSSTIVQRSPRPSVFLARFTKWFWPVLIRILSSDRVQPSYLSIRSLNRQRMRNF